jgi:hypothetical protein
MKRRRFIINERIILFNYYSREKYDRNFAGEVIQKEIA